MQVKALSDLTTLTELRLQGNALGASCCFWGPSQVGHGQMAVHQPAPVPPTTPMSQGSRCTDAELLLPECTNPKSIEETWGGGPIGPQSLDPLGSQRFPPEPCAGGDPSKQKLVGVGRDGAGVGRGPASHGAEESAVALGPPQTMLDGKQGIHKDWGTLQILELGQNCIASLPPLRLGTFSGTVDTSWIDFLPFERCCFDGGAEGCCC